MLCGYTPFRSEDPADLYREVSACKLTFHDRYWKQVSQVAKDFISRLVVADPVERATADEALAHEWLSLKKAGEGVALDAEHDLSGLRENFNPKARWRSAINGAIAMGRLRRAGSDRSEREQLRKNSMPSPTDASDDERSETESAGWRTPAEPSTPGRDYIAHGSRASLGVNNGLQGPHRRLSSSSNVLDPHHEENDNVKVHPPRENEHASADVNEGMEEESGTSQPLREDEVVQRVTQQIPQSEPDSIPQVAAKNLSIPNHEDDEHLYRVPGSFDLSNPVTGEDEETDQDNNQNRNHEHGWIGLLQRLGIHSHHRE